MKSLFTLIISLLFMFVRFGTTQSKIAGSNIDKRQLWIESILNEKGILHPCKDYIFYCTGHHGIIWSAITSDSSGICLFNGTTRNHVECADYSHLDTLSFIKNNFKTITWGFDSLSNDAQYLIPLKDDAYNPIFTELYIVKNNKIIFCYKNTDCYSECDGIDFRYKLDKLAFLMFWLASPSVRSYLPIPCD